MNSDVTGVISFHNLPHDELANKIRLFTDLVGRTPQVTVRGDAYDGVNNCVFIDLNYFKVLNYTDEALAVSVNNMLTWVHTKTGIWSGITMW